MTVPTNKDLQDAFMEGFCYAEDIGHTTGKKLAAEAERRYPATAPREEETGLREYFAKLRNDPKHHLGLGDIRLTMAQQDEVIALAARPVEGEKK